MNVIKKYLKKQIPKHIIRRIFKSKLGYYHSVSICDNDVAKGDYKDYVGGGADRWELRGSFQIYFLKKMGLRHDSKLLDIGCGPIRAGAHFIRYLDEGNYHGVDYNEDFIKIAERITAEKGLVGKKPTFEVIKNFYFNHIQPVFDYAILFSVFNHCHHEQREHLFRNISTPMKKGGLVYITHATGFKSYMKNPKLRLTNQFNYKDFDIIKFGWKRKDQIFPIIELTID